jgi:hypothetical protein
MGAGSSGKQASVSSLAEDPWGGLRMEPSPDHSTLYIIPEAGTATGAATGATVGCTAAPNVEGQGYVTG